MPAKKAKSIPVTSSGNKRGRPPKKTIKKATAKAAPKKAKPTVETHSDESSDNNTLEMAQNGNSTNLENNSENTNANKTESEIIAELQTELRKSEQSKRVLYNALVRERSLNNDKPSVASTASKTGHVFSKPYSQLSGDQKKDRIRLLANVVGEFADPKDNSPNKTMEVKFVMEALTARWEKTPADFQ